MRTRLVITGIGVVTPCGVGTEPLWSQVTAGACCIRPLKGFDASHLSCAVGGQAEAFQPSDYLDARFIRRTDRFSQMGLVAAQQALTGAGLSLDDLERFFDAAAGHQLPEYERAAGRRGRVGITVGNNLGGWEFAEREVRNLWIHGPRCVSPYMATAWFPAAAQGNISIRLGIKGIGRTFVCDRVSSAFAIIHAAQCIRRGHADLMLAGGAEAPFSPYACLCYETSGLMSRQATKRPSSCFRPFDRDHDGLVAAEGAAFLVLETEEGARNRGAHIYAELAGWAIGHQPYDPEQPDAGGLRFAETISLALERAGEPPRQVDYVCAAGSAVPAEDAAEARSIRLALGKWGTEVPVSAPKATFGNTFGAATAIDVVLGLLSMQYNCVPPTANLEEPALGCELNHIRHQALPRDIRVVLVNAQGIGGTFASLVLRRYTG